MNDEKYDYEAAVKEDIKSYLEENDYGFVSESDEDDLQDRLFVCDSVTGNASGSYTMSAWKAESNLCHNMDLVQECAEEFGDEAPDLSKGAEHWDVSIRCMMVGRVLHDVVEEWNEDHPEPDGDED